MTALRTSGIEVLGNIAWGSHFCTFYETKQDLLDILVPYFKAGLENDEYCLWIVPDSTLITVQEAKQALKQAVPDLDHYFTNGSIEVFKGLDWYLEKDVFDLERVTKAWDAKLKEALKRGYIGIRVSGDTYWLGEKDIWQDFFAYEKQLDDSIVNKPMLVMCTYPLNQSRASELLDVMQAHQLAVARRQGRWELMETPELMQAKAEIKRLNEELEQRVAERTSELEKAMEELKYEIAERKKSELLIIREKELSNEIIDSIPGVFMVLDEGLRFVRWNKNVELVSGYTSKEILQLHAINDFYDDVNDRKTVQGFMKEAFKKGTVHGEATPHTKDGRRIPFYFNTRLINYEGRQCIVCAAIDITERKQAEDALRRNEDRIRLIINTIPTMAWTVQPDGIVDFYNKVWLDYAGEDASRDPNGIVHPEDLPVVMEKWLVNMAAGQAYKDEMRLRGADGTYRWFLVRTAPLRDEQGNLVKWYGVSIDIEDSKRAEDELQLAYQRLSYHFENTPLAVIELDKDLFIKRWSKRAEEMFGWKASEALGKNVYHPDFPIIYDEDIKSVYKINEELIEGLVNRNLSLNRNNTKDGSVIYSEWYNSVLRDEQGNVITILSLVHDVTERKKAEETLLQSYEEIRRLTNHLQSIREEERTNIAREIHDELGQQLTVLKMEVKGLNKKLHDANEGTKQKIGDILELLDSSVKSIRRISSELRPSLLDNLGLVAAMEWHSKEFEKRWAIKIVFNEPKEELELPDSKKNGLFRIFQESLTNISRHANANKIKVSLEKKSQQLILSIEDDGQGFEKEKISGKETLGILGMKERSEMMGGYYEINSIPGKGTIIIVAVPYNGKQ
ncbi:MAG: domain S-box protein [Ferruginibacter sp.]|nr:domain S-box protein [Ferruginibacter sp.]